MKTKKGQLKSFEPVTREGWTTKMSLLNDVFILLVIRSEFTGQTIVRHFTNENEAVEFIEFVHEHDSTDEQDI